MLTAIAHLIRNNTSRMAGAICALESISRWAVTGTPIQNRLSDLATLVKFVRAHPYTDSKRFELDIVQPWKSGDDEKATQRLKRLSACLILRRPKGTISLPPKHDKLCPVEFTLDERAVYDEIRQGVIAKIEGALYTSGREGQSYTSVYHNALQQIESLRLFCNLGLHYRARNETTGEMLIGNGHSWNHRAQNLFNLQWQKGPIVCLGCSSTLEVDETITDQSCLEECSPRFFQCLQFSCGECVKRSVQVNRSLSCGHQPPCVSAPISTDISRIEDPSLMGHFAEATKSSLPSKTRVLIADLKRQPPGVKRFVF